MKYLSLLILLASCHTIKYVDRVQIQTDSTAVHKVDSLVNLKILDSIGYQNIIQALSEQQIVFKDTGSVRIEYRPDGSIETIQGQVRSLNSKLLSSQNQSGFWKRQYDSLANHKSKDSIQIKTEIQKVNIEKKSTFIPWWIWAIVAGLAIVAFYKKVYLFGKNDLEKRNPIQNDTLSKSVGDSTITSG